MALTDEPRAREITLVVYMPCAPRPWEYVRAADAIESAFSLSKYAPFRGTEPIHFGFTWEIGARQAGKFNGKNLLLIWNGITRQLMSRKFLNPDGAEILPGEVEFKQRPEGKVYSQSYMTFWRK